MGSGKKNNRNNEHNLNNSYVNNDIQNCLALIDDTSPHNNSKDSLNKLCDNESCKSISKCKSKICKLMPNFVSMDKVISTSSKSIFDV